jgi:hypothetical protein
MRGAHSLRAGLCRGTTAFSGARRGPPATCLFSMKEFQIRNYRRTAGMELSSNCDAAHNDVVCGITKPRIPWGDSRWRRASARRAPP